MEMMHRRIIINFLIVIMILLASSWAWSANIDNAPYASTVIKSGAFNIDSVGHAGVIIQHIPHTASDSQLIIQETNPNTGLSGYVDFNTFLGSGNYMGSFRTKNENWSPAFRDEVVYQAKRALNKSYVFIHLYQKGSGEPWYHLNDVPYALYVPAAFRCDGLAEWSIEQAIYHIYDSSGPHFYDGYYTVNTASHNPLQIGINADGFDAPLSPYGIADVGVIYTITANDGSNGDIDPEGTFDVAEGDDQQFTANPDTNYVVDKWKVDGSEVQTGGNSYTLSNIQSDHTVYVSFKYVSQTYTITASDGSNGDIDPEGTFDVTEGDDQQFTANPDTNYVVDKWYLDGSAVQTGGNSYTLSNIQSDHTVYVSFKYVEQSDTDSPDTSITDGPSGTITYNDVTFIYTGSDNVTSTSNLVYSYELDGYDSSWSSYTSSTSKSYNDLPNGSYTFYVKAKDEAGNVDFNAAYRSFTVDYISSDLILFVTPDSQSVTANSGTTTFTVDNTGSGTMSWTASVISGENWLSISSGSSGTNAGTISCSYTANTGEQRTGTIRITASGAIGSPVDVTVVQGDGQLVLDVQPLLRDVSPDSGTTTFNVANRSSGTMNWTAQVISGGSWLSILSGSSGTNTGTISCSYLANIGEQRTGTIRVTAVGATGSPVDVTVSQIGKWKVAIYGETQGLNFANHADEFDVILSIPCWNGSMFDSRVNEFLAADVICIGGDDTFTADTAQVIESAVFNDGKILMINFWSDNKFGDSLPGVTLGNTLYGSGIDAESRTNPTVAQILSGLPDHWDLAGDNLNRRAVSEKPGATVITRFSDGTPALIVWNYGEGKVIYQPIECMCSFYVDQCDQIAYQALKWALEGTESPIIKGDVNNDGAVSLADAILALQVCAGITPAATVYIEADVNGDGKIGIEEAIYALQVVAGIRSSSVP